MLIIMTISQWLCVCTCASVYKSKNDGILPAVKSFNHWLPMKIPFECIQKLRELSLFPIPILNWTQIVYEPSAAFVFSFISNLNDDHLFESFAVWQSVSNCSFFYFHCCIYVNYPIAHSLTQLKNKSNQFDSHRLWLRLRLRRHFDIHSF